MSMCPKYGDAASTSPSLIGTLFSACHEPLREDRAASDRPRQVSCTSDQLWGSHAVMMIAGNLSGKDASGRAHLELLP